MTPEPASTAEPKPAPSPGDGVLDEATLLDRLRDGADGAFSELFRRHAAAVRRFVSTFVADRSDADDLVAETFFRVLQALRRGTGPTDNVRAYLFTVARRISYEWHGNRREVPVAADELANWAAPATDRAGRWPEHRLISTAFTSLPERWRTVLWQTEVEGERPAVVAPYFGLSPNATAALARRARRGLRAAYLQAHLASERTADGCEPVLAKLGGYTAGSVTGTEATKIAAHLRRCPTCRSTQHQLADVCSTLRAHAGALALVVPAWAVATNTGVGGVASVAQTVFGSIKMKVGLALASSAAVGTLGLAVGPALLDQERSEPVGLFTGTDRELTVSSVSSAETSPPAPPVALLPSTPRPSTSINGLELPTSIPTTELAPAGPAASESPVARSLGPANVPLPDVGSLAPSRARLDDPAGSSSSSSPSSVRSSRPSTEPTSTPGEVGTERYAETDSSTPP